MTEKKTVLFFPLNSPGHINSCIGLADKLRDEYNYRVIFLVLGQPMGDTIEDHKHELIALDELEPLEDYEIDDNSEDSIETQAKLAEQRGDKKKKFPGATKWPHLIKKTQSMFRLPPVEAFIKSVPFLEEIMLNEVSANHESYSKAIDDINPDLIIVDAYFIPPCVLNGKTPWIKIWSANPISLVQPKPPNQVKPPQMCGFRLFNKEIRNKMRQEEPEKWNDICEEWKSAKMHIIDSLSKLNLKTDTFFESYNCKLPPKDRMGHDSPFLNAYIYPKCLDYDQDDDILEYPKTFIGFDSLIRSHFGKSNLEEKTKYWADKFEIAKQNKKETVYFSMGSIASGIVNMVEKFLDILKLDKDRLYVVSKGINGDQIKLHDNMIGANYLPQTFFLERVDLAIIHGGNNSVTECCYFGKPMVVVPFFADQLDNAFRIEDLGYGRYVDTFNCTSEALLGAIEKVSTDKDMINRCKLAGEQMRKRDGIQTLAVLVDKLLNDGNIPDELLEECNKGATAAA